MPIFAVKRKESRQATSSRPAISGRGHSGRGQKAGSSPAHDFSRRLMLHQSPASIRPKLTATVPGDVYEREADHVAAQAMRAPTPEPLGAAESAGEGSDRAEPRYAAGGAQEGPERVSWWRRMFG